MGQNFLRQAAIPALNKLGSKTIGVFTEYLPQRFTKLVVVIPFSSLETYVKVNEQLAKDSKYQQVGTAYLTVDAALPVYERIESLLFQSFAIMPRLELPEKSHEFLNFAAMKARMKLLEKRKWKCLIRVVRSVFSNE